ncbi:MAG: hypothetical protein K2G40_04840, partial [Muribaculaceae bacterium]|nr:hypothetical protein [Muribaculaceae bacterium]
MRRAILAIMATFALSAFAMTDNEVIAYIKQQMAAGKTEQQIGKELMAKGVTPEQAERIKTLYNSRQGSEPNVT